MSGGDEFAFLTCQRAVVYQEIHGDGRLGDLLERDGLRILGRAEGVANMDIADAGDGDDGTHGRLVYLHLLQSVKFVQLADLNAAHLVGIVVVYNHAILVDADGSVVHLADTDAAHIFIVIDGADENLRACGLVPLGSGDVPGWLGVCVKRYRLL